MPAKPPVKVSTRHDELILYILMNPEMKRGEIARDLGYSESWLSVIMSSDIFKSRMASLQEEYLAAAFANIENKLDATLGMALDRIMEQLEMGKIHDEDFYHKVLSAVHKLRSGEGGGISIQDSNVLVATAEELQQARSIMTHSAREAIPVLTTESPSHASSQESV